MIGLGTIVNVVAIIIGGTAGTFIKNGLNKKYKDIVMQAIGLSVIIVGISGALQSIFQVLETGELNRQHITIMIVSLVLGGVIGELVGIESKLESLGKWFQSRLSKENGNFAEGFVTASLVFCVGAMAIVGSLEDGLSGDTATLYAKSVLDGVAALVFASTLGAGVILSALPVLAYQGLITIMAGFLKPWLTDVLISQVSVTGGALIMAIGINLLGIAKIKVGNMLPAVIIPVIIQVISNMI